jgi:homoserine acetyltransferase
LDKIAGKTLGVEIWRMVIGDSVGGQSADEMGKPGHESSTRMEVEVSDVILPESDRGE